MQGLDHDQVRANPRLAPRGQRQRGAHIATAPFGANGFRVADAALAGQTGEALRLLRHAIASGVDPVPIVAVLASQLRTLVKVGAAGRGSSATVAKTLSMAPWQVDKARRSIAGWDGPGLGAAIQAVAAADVEVKGGGRDPVYAVERAILAISAARRSG